MSEFQFYQALYLIHSADALRHEANDRPDLAAICDARAELASAYAQRAQDGAE